ncbi:MAG TPA: hypothetical protein VFG84_07370 [Gemmatimonadaceae bacterium]|nr:hypothetical protein [Gemmatimonadaceae bacterium]
MRYLSSTAYRRFRSARFVSVAIGLVLAFGPIGCSDSLAPEPADAHADRIIFLSSRGYVGDFFTNARYDIYSMNADGSDLENLAESLGVYADLQATPDGRSLIFATWNAADGLPDGDCPYQIWSMATDGSQQRRLTTGDCHGAPRMSPDGNRVAYISTTTRSIHVANIDGSAPRDVSVALPPVSHGCSPEPKWDVGIIGWASSNRVVFSRHICGAGTTVYSADINGNGLVTHDFVINDIFVSPDGSRVAYWSGGQLMVTLADGSDPRILASGVIRANGEHLARPWSPDGTRLIYRKNDGIHIVDMDGIDVQMPTYPELRFDASFCAWSPDGNRLVFTVYERDTGGTITGTNLYLVNLDGSGVVNLTRQSGSLNYSAVWVRR